MNTDTQSLNKILATCHEDELEGLHLLLYVYLSMCADLLLLKSYVSSKNIYISNLTPPVYKNDNVS